jgi:UDP-N-acetylmuramoyl-L-alanyl-D-glutamate--2,6-diaminopimelate ligase
MKKLIPQKLKNYYHLLQAIAANYIYGFPSRGLKVIGVTGTNGKTTTVQMIGRILEEGGKKIAMASTINFKIGGKEWVNKTKFTTLSALSVQKFLRQAADAGCEYVVLETSSHSLDQNRVWGVEYRTAVITNVTREHLDYHKDMEHYRIAKLKLFQRVQVAVVNLDMTNAKDYLDCANDIAKYGFTTRADVDVRKYDCGSIETVQATDVDLGINYAHFTARETRFELQLPGLFNVENALAAVSVGLAEGIDIPTMKTALEKITGVPGRMEHIPNDRNIDIIVDYAVTPDSLEKLYGLVSLIRKRSAGQNALKTQVIAVMGSCGDRDRGKRPLMGGIVDKNTDFMILTNEDPYGEDPWQIINEVAKGIKHKIENQSFWKILDRREAIRKALALARPGDVVIITGKGAEEIMAIGNQRIPWNDKRVILEELAETLINA